MAETWNKKEREKKKKQKKKQKEERKQDRLETAKSKDPNDIFSYVDEYGNVSSTPPDPTKKFAIKLEDVEIGVPKRQAADPADLIRRGTVTFLIPPKGMVLLKMLSLNKVFSCMSMAWKKKSKNLAKLSLKWKWDLKVRAPIM